MIKPIHSKKGRAEKHEKQIKQHLSSDFAKSLSLRGIGVAGTDVRQSSTFRV